MFVGEHRVEIQLADFGKIADELRNGADYLRERVAVNGFSTAHATEDFRRRDAVEH